MILQVVALVCNFSGSCNSSTARLNHWELETLFHEFGHALHSLLSRTVFHHYYVLDKCYSIITLLQANHISIVYLITHLSIDLVGLPAFFWYQGGSWFSWNTFKSLWVSRMLKLPKYKLLYFPSSLWRLQ